MIEVITSSFLHKVKKISPISALLLTKDTTTSPEHTFLISAAMSNYGVEQVMFATGCSFGYTEDASIGFYTDRFGGGFFFKLDLKGK